MEFGNITSKIHSCPSRRFPPPENATRSGFKKQVYQFYGIYFVISIKMYCNTHIDYNTAKITSTFSFSLMHLTSLVIKGPVCSI